MADLRQLVSSLYNKKVKPGVNPILQRMNTAVQNRVGQPVRQWAAQPAKTYNNIQNWQAQNRARVQNVTVPKQYDVAGSYLDRLRRGTNESRALLKKPGIGNKAFGGLTTAATVFDATPVGMGTSALIAGVTALKDRSQGQNFGQAFNKRIADPYNMPAEDILGVKGVAAIPLNMALLNPKGSLKSIKNIRNIKGIAKGLKTNTAKIFRPDDVASLDRVSDVIRIEGLQTTTGKKATKVLDTLADAYLTKAEIDNVWNGKGTVKQKTIKLITSLQKKVADAPSDSSYYDYALGITGKTPQPPKGVGAKEFSFNMGKGVKQTVQFDPTQSKQKLKILSNELPLSQKQLIQVQAGQKIPSQSLSQGSSLKVAGSEQTIQLPSGKTQKIRVVEPQSQAKLPTAKAASESRLQRQLVGEKVDTKPLKVSSSNGIIPPEARSEIKAVERAVDKKVGIFDYMRTPDRVLKKIGLEKESKQIKQAYNNYLDELPKEIDKVTAWSNRVKNSKGAEQRIFKYLDGQNQKLTGEELKVAKEIESYLGGWADKLGLPKDGRIASYITHIFEKDFIQKEFDPDLAKIIDEKIPGSVYDPFLQKRLGQQGYVEDVFRALDAYVKRATRKVNMDPALSNLEANSNKLDLESWKYVKNYTDRINLRPTEWDSLLDNAIKQSPVGYRAGQRPTASITRKLRQMVYRGTLGLNVGSAVRNLTQGVNTYAQLGEKYTGIGYMKVLRSLASSDDELKRVGVLRNNIIEDRSLSATKKTWENIDKGLFSFFEAAERINRGAAYYGAKAKSLKAGKSEQEAIQAGIEMARKTQFTFGSVDTPVALQSDLVKLFTQFQSFNVKQTEFLGEMAKNKEYAGLIRWLGANAVILFTVGQAMGWDWKDMIPFGSVIGGEQKIGETPPIQLAQNIGKIALGGKDKFGQPIDGYDVADSITPFVPAGVQLMGKTIPGLYDVNRGYATSDWGVKKLANIATGKEGKIKFPISQTPGNYIRAGVFGSSKLPAAREYKEKDRTVFGDNQAETFKSLDRRGRQQMYSDRNERLGKAGGSGMFGGLFNNQAVEPQTTSTYLPTAKEDLATLYKSATNTVEGYREKRVKSEAGLTQTKVEDLQADVDQAIKLKKQIEKEHPELILDIGIDTYKSGGGATTEDRAKWVAEKLESVKTEEEYQEILNKLYDGNVLTKSVIEELAEAHDISLNEYTEGGKRKSTGKTLKAKKPKKITVSTPTIKAIKFAAPKRLRVSIAKAPKLKVYKPKKIKLAQAIKAKKFAVIKPKVTSTGKRATLKAKR